MTVDAASLDARILEVIATWRDNGVVSEDALDSLALDLFRYQVTFNAAYRAFAESLGYDERCLPADWRAIPAVPASAFKDATLASFDVATAALEFHTSGTTSARFGTHYMETSRLYDAALLAGFERFMLDDGARPRFVNLVPDPGRNPYSSLGYMMARVGEHFGNGRSSFYLRDDGIDLDALRRDLAEAHAAAVPVCIAGTAFAFASLVDAFADGSFPCAAGSRVMETGGFKGREHAVSRDDLYARIAGLFAIDESAIVAEYGMTELTSQYYDAVDSRMRAVRVKTGPPWLRTLVVDERGVIVPVGEVGFLRHVDLANRSSVIAIQTEDRGYETDGGFVLLGRDADAPLRGCSLDAEDLLAARD
jgi:Acyl-protein synthetase, LuxE